MNECFEPDDLDFDDLDDTQEIEEALYSFGDFLEVMPTLNTGVGIDLDAVPLDDVLDQFTDHRGYAIIPTPLWKKANDKYRQFEIKRALAKQIIRHNAPFPLNPPKESKARLQFEQLLQTPWQKLITNPVNDGRPYQSRIPYASWTLDNTLALIPPGSNFNAISNHFQFDNRMSCGGWRDPSPKEAWSTEENLYRLRWTYWSMNKATGPSSLSIIRRGFLLSADGIYLAAQFRPPVAKAMYGWIGARFVLDPSCGWGDRLAAVFVTPTVKVYAGCDPNPDTFKVYPSQCVAYEQWIPAKDGGMGTPTIEYFTVSGYPAFRSRGVKDVLIVNGPFEDIDWAEVQALVAPDGFDLAFTSPPYFGVERYAKGSDKEKDQSWSRYGAIDAWLNSFFFVLLERCCKVLADGGVLAMNIVDPIIKDKPYAVCEPMIKKVVGEGLNFVGVVPMAMARRPSSSTGMGSIPPDRFSEPIWMFRKGRTDLPPVPGKGSATLQDNPVMGFFDD